MTSPLHHSTLQIPSFGLFSSTFVLLVFRTTCPLHSNDDFAVVVDVVVAEDVEDGHLPLRTVCMS